MAYALLQQLNVQMEEVEELLIELILEGKVEGRIDQVAMRLELDKTFVDHDSVIPVELTMCVGKALRKDGMQPWISGRKHWNPSMRRLSERILV